jgi:hypothetical protein
MRQKKVNNSRTENARDSAYGCCLRFYVQVLLSIASGACGQICMGARQTFKPAALLIHFCNDPSSESQSGNGVVDRLSTGDINFRRGVFQQDHSFAELTQGPGRTAGEGGRQELCLKRADEI